MEFGAILGAVFLGAAPLVVAVGSVWLGWKFLSQRELGSRETREQIDELHAQMDELRDRMEFHERLLTEPREEVSSDPGRY